MAGTPARVGPAVAPTPAPTPAPPVRAATPSARSTLAQSGPPAVRLGSDARTTAPSTLPGASGGGQPLLPDIRKPIERSLGTNLLAVRVHTDSQANSVARNLSARAVTYGNHIFLGPGEQPDDITLLAHEAAHVVQQQAAPVPQRLGAGGSDSYEREAHQASAAVVRQESFSVRERTSRPVAQRWGLSSVLNGFADKANIIPGFRMFTIILGINPINMSRVDRSAANILRAMIEFIPGGGLITQALDNSGVFDKVGNWVEEQIRTLGMSGSMIKDAITRFIDTLSLGDITNLDGVWERAKRIFTEPIDRIINFAKGLVTGIVKFVKDAILLPLAKLAEGTPGWDLLIAVLGKNPITGEAVPRTAETLVGGFMKLIGQEEVWENIKKANAIARVWAWFQGALSAVMGFVSQIPTLAINTFKSLELVDIILVPRAFAKVAAVFGGFIGNFITWAGNAVWTLLEIIFEALAPTVMPYLKKAAAAFKTILKDPIAFIGNLVRAGKLGFEMFAANILTHLKTALIKWITGPLGDAGVYIPKSFDLMEIIKLVLSVLGLTWQNIRSKLVKIIPDPVLTGLEKTAGVLVTLVKDGPAAAWDQIKTELSELKDQMIAQVTQMVTTEVVKAAVVKLVSMLNPAGAVIQAIMAIYNTVTFFLAKLKQIAAVVASFIDSISAIAAGQVDNAAKKVEQTMANTLTIVIAFLAKFAGLGNIPEKLVGIIKKIRQPIDKGLDKIVAWLGKMLEKAKDALMGKKDKPEEAKAGGTTVKQEFSMGPASHTLTATVDGQTVKITMASNADIIISVQLNAAIDLIQNDKEVDEKGNPVKREKSQKAAILSDLQAAKIQVDDLRRKYIESGRTIAFEKFVKPLLAAIIGNLAKLAKKKPEITSLKPLISLGRPRYIPKGWDIRKKLYDKGWKALSESMRQTHSGNLYPRLASIWKLRNDTSNPGNYNKAEAQWIKMQTDREIPSVKKAPSFATYDHTKDFSKLEYQTDHNPSLGTVWNASEKKKSDDDQRSATTLGKGTSKLKVITAEENNERSHDEPKFERDVGPDFESAVANSPKGSMTLDGKPFDDKP